MDKFLHGNVPIWRNRCTAILLHRYMAIWQNHYMAELQCVWRHSYNAMSLHGYFLHGYMSTWLQPYMTTLVYMNAV
jgi:hypothetical protein